jgi:hypothetical protein
MKLSWLRFASIAALLAPWLSGQAVQLKVAVSLRDRPPGHRTASWKLRRSDSPTSKPIDLPLEVPGLGGVDLPPGVWLVQVDVPGYWHSPRVVTLADREQTLDFALWPVAPVTGTLAVPKGDKAPNPVSVRFQSAPSAAGERLPAECVIANSECVSENTDCVIANAECVIANADCVREHADWQRRDTATSTARAARLIARAARATARRPARRREC